MGRAYGKSLLSASESQPKLGIARDAREMILEKLVLHFHSFLIMKSTNLKQDKSPLGFRLGQE